MDPVEFKQHIRIFKVPVLGKKLVPGHQNTLGSGFNILTLKPKQVGAEVSLPKP